MEIARHTSPDDCAGLADADLLAWDAPDLQLCHQIELDPQRGIALAIECERLAWDGMPASSTLTEPVSPATWASRFMATATASSKAMLHRATP